MENLSMVKKVWGEKRALTVFSVTSYSIEENSIGVLIICQICNRLSFPELLHNKIIEINFH